MIKDPSINNKEQKTIIIADLQYCLPFLSEINDILDSSQEKLNIHCLPFLSEINDILDSSQEKLNIHCLPFLSEINDILDSSQEKLNIQQLVFNTAIDYHEFALAINLI